jgi:predicted MFS family arabinose efflux permease
MSSSTRWDLVCALLATGVIGAFQVGKAAIAVPALMQDLRLGLVTAALIVGAFGILGTVIGLPAGLTVSALPARRTLIAGLLVMGGGSLLGAFAGSAGALIAARAVEGLGFVCVTLSAPRLFARVSAPSDGPMIFAFWGAYMPTGSAVMMLAGPAIIQAWGWQGLWLLNGLLPIGYALVIARLAIPNADALEPADRRLKENLRAAFATPGPLLIAVCFGIYTLQYFALASLFPALLVDRLGLGIAVAGLLSAAVVLANAVGNVAAGVLVRLGVPLWTVLVGGFVTCGVTAFGIFSGAMPIVAVALMAAVSLAVTGLIPASLFAATSVVATHAALIPITIGLIVQIGMSGQLLGPTLLAVYVERLGWPNAPYFFVAVMAAGIAGALALRAALRSRDATAT